MIRRSVLRMLWVSIPAAAQVSMRLVDDNNDVVPESSEVSDEWICGRCEGNHEVQSCKVSKAFFRLQEHLPVRKQGSTTLRLLICEHAQQMRCFLRGRTAPKLLPYRVWVCSHVHHAPRPLVEKHLRQMAFNLALATLHIYVASSFRHCSRSREWHHMEVTPPACVIDHFSHQASGCRTRSAN